MMVGEALGGEIFKGEGPVLDQTKDEILGDWLPGEKVAVKGVLLQIEDGDKVIVPDGGGLTVIVMGTEMFVEQEKLWTILRYMVVVINAPGE